QGNLASAESVLRQNLEARRRVLGPRHQDTEETLRELADLLPDAGKPAEAAGLFQELAALRPEDADYAARRILALIAARDPEAARATTQAVLAHFGRTTNPRIAAVLLPACLLLPATAGQAATLVNLAGHVPGPERERLLGAALCRAGRFADAIEHLGRDGAP